MSTSAMKFTSEITVKYIDHMGNDTRIAMAAWASRDLEEGILKANAEPEKVPGLINYLIKHRHGTPFEAGAIQFTVHAPIFVWREWHRHRIGFSYNEESGRYTQLKPVFYIPPIDRPMMKVENWKPGRPKFLTLKEYYTNKEKDTVASVLPLDQVIERNVKNTYEKIIYEMKEGYKNEYERYVYLLGLELDNGLARDNLPVGIYSSCWVTANPRSIMHFLSLRTHEPEAKFVSYPLYEIEVAARKVEDMFARYWPITYSAFVENGRIAP